MADKLRREWRGPGHPSKANAPTERATLRIESLAAGGAGVAKLASGLVVFVAHAAPGDVIDADVSTAAKPALGKIVRVIERGPERVDPPCPYVTSCGGCDWMHLSSRAQEDAHAAIVVSAIARTVPWAALPELRRHPAPAALGYRTRARLFARNERGRLAVGYRAHGTHALAAIDACLVLDPTITPVLADLSVVLAGATGEGEALVVRGVGGLPAVDLTWRGDLVAATWATIDARIASGTWAGARVALEGVSRPASFGDPRAWMTAADGAPLAISAGGFAQPSEAGAAMLARRVAELAALTEGLVAGNPVWKEARPRHVVELFAGSGTLSVLLARGAASFTAIELEPEAVTCARQNLAARGLDAKVVLADADAFVIPPRTEVVVLDPPRAGASGATAAIAAASARAVIYVACDAATLARDLIVLTRAGFVITHLETFELFPQTSHIETVVRLVRVRPAR